MIPVLDIPHNPPPGFAVREATLSDVEDLTRLWYSSFNLSHEFWNVATPRDVPTREWLNATWSLGLETGPAMLKTFVVEDLSPSHGDGRPAIVALARWHVPQADGSQDIPLPNYPSEWDSELTEALWGGMPRNRAAVMGQRLHWMLEFLAVDHAYQQKGLGFTLVDWGCRQADSLGLEVYLDATIKGLPFYRRHFGFMERKALGMPRRPDTYGTYELMASVRPAREWRRFTPGDEKPLATSGDMDIVEVVEVMGA